MQFLGKLNFCCGSLLATAGMIVEFLIKPTGAAVIGNTTAMSVMVAGIAMMVFGIGLVILYRKD